MGTKYSNIKTNTSINNNIEYNFYYNIIDYGNSKNIEKLSSNYSIYKNKKNINFKILNRINPIERAIHIFNDKLIKIPIKHLVILLRNEHFIEKEIEVILKYLLNYFSNIYVDKHKCKEIKGWLKFLYS